MKIFSLWKRRQSSTELTFWGVLCTDVSGGKCRGFHEMPKTLHRISCNLVNGIALMKESLPALPSFPPLVGDVNAGVHKMFLRSCAVFPVESRWCVPVPEHLVLGAEGSLACRPHH